MRSRCILPGCFLHSKGAEVRPCRGGFVGQGEREVLVRRAVEDHYRWNGVAPGEV